MAAIMQGQPLLPFQRAASSAPAAAALSAAVSLHRPWRQLFGRGTDDDFAAAIAARCATAEQVPDVTHPFSLVLPTRPQ